MAEIADLAELALERIRRIMERWPRPGSGQGVRADAVLAGLAPLVPVAQMVLKLPDGYAKGYYQGVGFLSGTPRIVPADKALAAAVIQDVNVVLPAAGERALTRELYATIKARAYKLLGLATDLDVTQGQLAKVGAGASSAWDRWVSLPPVVELGAEVIPEPVQRVIDGLTDTLARNDIPPLHVEYDPFVITFYFATGFRAARAADVLPLSLSIAGRINKVATRVLSIEAGAMVAVNDPMAVKAEAAVQRVVRFVNSFPRPAAGQRIPVAATATALEPLRPLATKIAALPLGTKKGSIAGSQAPETLYRVLAPFSLFNLVRTVEGESRPATGYLSGSDAITEADRTAARYVLNALDAMLPIYSAAELEPADYEALKREAHRLLMVATDLDLDTTAADKVALAWSSVKLSAQDLASGLSFAAKEGASMLKYGLIAAGITAGAVATVALLKR